MANNDVISMKGLNPIKETGSLQQVDAGKKHGKFFLRRPSADSTSLQKKSSAFEETNSRILNLMDSIEKLTEVTKSQMKAIEQQQKRMNTILQERQKTDEGNDGFERSTVRLDGIEVYAVVSALTVASSIACLDAYSDIYSSNQEENISYVTTFLHIVFIASNTIGILTGLHATLVFSLATMYGRTAVGLGRDMAFQKFFADTGTIRYRGFQTFLWSLYSFTLQCIIIIFTKFLPSESICMKFATLAFACISVSPVYTDTNFIIKKAEVIFDPTFFEGRHENTPSLIVPPARRTSFLSDDSSIDELDKRSLLSKSFSISLSDLRKRKKMPPQSYRDLNNRSN